MTLHWSKDTGEVNTTSFDELALEEVWTYGSKMTCRTNSSECKDMRDERRGVGVFHVVCSEACSPRGPYHPILVHICYQTSRNERSDFQIVVLR